MNFSVLRRLLFSMKPETAHRVVMANLNWAVHFGLHKKLSAFPVENPVVAMGIRFPNCVGLAAGMTPDGSSVSALGGLGFGFVEVGTVTPLPGKPTAEPRRFRLQSVNGFIHRECGRSVDCDTMLANLKSADPFRLRGGIVGISLGHTPQTPSDHILNDIQEGMEKVYGAANYLTICASSLTDTCNLEALIAGCAQKRDALSQSTGKRLPLLAKLSPDSDDDTLKQTVHLLIQYGFDGVIATSSSAGILEDIHGMPHSLEKGEVSGSPLFERALEVVRLVSTEAGDRLTVIACGGILSGVDAVDMLKAGAQLVQLHTGLIYRGPALISECSDEIAQWREEAKQQ